jgi:acetoin utilization deacetylase AcuC-like enzyme
MRLFYADNKPLPLPEEHSFPAPKYGWLLERIQSTGIVRKSDLLIAQPATDGQLLLVHTLDYVTRMTQGQMTDKEMRRVGFPWSAALVERSRRSVGATIAACRTALEEGFSGNLGGGTHHAYPDHGQGYCVFNDVAVAIRTLQAEGRARRAVVVDLDVHQGNGTAAIFAGDADVFTFSVHSEKNFPYHKELSSLDIALPDGAGDDVFIAAVQKGIAQALQLAQADLAIYIAGADPYIDDRLGRLAVTKDGLARRDRLVFEMVRQAGLPLALVMGGGYARQIDDTVDIHLQTYRIARELWGATF